MKTVLSLCQKLIQCPSVTPQEGGALLLMKQTLEALGFQCFFLEFSSVPNLYAVRGQGNLNFCFAGHTDVVPPGPREVWQEDPFGGQIQGDRLYGRGAVDMKGAIAAYTGAVERILSQSPDFTQNCRLSFLLTGDEEGEGIYGTQAVLNWLKERGETLDFCLIGEPTSQKTVGDTVKMGRRGSLQASLVAYGKQGHVAYPHLADNPIPRLVTFLSYISGVLLDEGQGAFPPSSLQITTVDVGNPVHNVIPAQARAHLNIRYNPLHTAVSLEDWLQMEGKKAGVQVECRSSAEAFLSPSHPFQDRILQAMAEVRGEAPQVTTDGGTSDGRFLSQMCPILELGLLNATAHQGDEHTSLGDLQQLTHLYEAILIKCLKNLSVN